MLSGGLFGDGQREDTTEARRHGGSTEFLVVYKITVKAAPSFWASTQIRDSVFLVNQNLRDKHMLSPDKLFHYIVHQSRARSS